MTDDLDFGFERILESWRRGHHTVQPGIVTEFSNKATPTVSVQPVFQRIFDGEDEPQTLPIIEDVPVLYPGGGDYLLTYDIKVNSYVLLIVPERSIAAFMQTGQVGDPKLGHVGELHDAIAIPGLIPSPSALPNEIEADTITLQKKDGAALIQVKGDDVNLIGATITTDGTTETVLQTGADWAVQFTALKSAFDTLKADFNALVSTFSGHTHPYVDTPAGAAVTSPTTTPGTSSGADMAGAKVTDVRLP